MKKRSLLYFLILAAIILFGQYVVFWTMEKDYLSKLQANERISVSLASTELTDWISQVLQEITYLSSKDDVTSYI